MLDCPNACISFAGHVIIWTGLLNAMSNKDELAAVLSHELSHVLMDHPVEAVSIDMLRHALAISLLPMLVGGFFAPRLFLTAATTYFSSGLLALYASRIREQEADYVGMLLMADAGFDPASTVPSWKKIVNFTTRYGCFSILHSIRQVDRSYFNMFAPLNYSFTITMHRDANFTLKCG